MPKTKKLKDPPPPASQGSPEKGTSRSAGRVVAIAAETAAAASSAAAGSSSKKSPATARGSNGDSMNIVMPNSLYNNSTGECTVLVQIDPEDSSTLDYAGAVGAIGRLEADATGVTLDLKGRRYQGRIYPGPTALVLSVVKSKNNGENLLKVDGMTDEFCRLVETGKNALDMLNGVTEGHLDSSSSDDYSIGGEDNNYRAKKKSKSAPAGGSSTGRPPAEDRTKKISASRNKRESGQTSNKRTAGTTAAALSSTKAKKRKTSFAAAGKK